MVDTSVRLQSGRVDTRVKPARGPGSRYQIITPAAVAAVRGTDFRVSAETGKPVMRSEVTEGSVGVGNAGKSTTVNAGFGLVAEAGKVPDKPRKLLPAADLSGLPKVQKQLPLEFTWPAIKGANGYRFQIAPSTDFESLLVDQHSEKNTAGHADLPDGHYALRIRSIDEVGLEGLNSVRRFEVDARPFPPVTSSPANADIVRESTPLFSWSAAEDSNGYRIQIAQDAGFTRLVIDETTDQASYRQAQPLTPGEYQWRVASIDDSGDQGPYNQPQRFIYRQPLEAPQLQQPLVNRANLVLSWSEVDGAAGYQVQLASDPYFRGMQLDMQFPGPQADIPRPPSQIYFLRVRALNAAGEAGPFSTPFKVYVPPLYPWWPLVLAVPLLLVL